VKFSAKYLNDNYLNGDYKETHVDVIIITITIAGT